MDRPTRKKRVPTQATIERRKLYRFKRSETYRRELAKFRKGSKDKVQQNVEKSTLDIAYSDSSTLDTDHEPLSDATIAPNNNDTSGSDSDTTPIHSQRCDEM